MADLPGTLGSAIFLSTLRWPDLCPSRWPVEELRDLVGREDEAFSNHVLHYASSLQGTRQYWFKQRSRLIAMLDSRMC